MSMVIFTKSGCPNCVTAKQVMHDNGIKYSEIGLDNEERMAEFCQQNPGVRQMPQLFWKGERIGGLEGLRAWINWKGEK